MRKIILVALIVIIAIVALTACAPDAQSDAYPETVKAIIESVGENALLVQPLEGLDNIDVIYLNYADDMTMNVSDNAPLEPGTIVYVKIGNEIMESYPPQVQLIDLIRTEIDEEITMTPIMDIEPEVASPDEDTGESSYSGIVHSKEGEQYVIMGIYSGQITVTIPDSLITDDIDPIESGSLVGLVLKEENGSFIATQIDFCDPEGTISIE